MVWSITASNVELNVDIIFEENSTIGQRIKLSEQVCRALATMKCPDLLQPQQIQGLDYDSLFPVIRWLVRRVLEVRRLTGNLVRMQAENQFSQHYELPEDRQNPSSQLYLNHVCAHFRPQRLFMQHQHTEVAIADKTTATLLEYGEKLYGQDFRDEEAEEARREKQSRTAKGAAALEEKEKERAARVQESEHKALEEEKRRLAALQENMAAAEGGAAVSGASVGNIVKKSADIIREAAESYGKNTEEFNEAASQGQGKASAAQTHKRQMDALNRKIEMEKEKEQKRLTGYQASLQKKKLAQALLQKKQAYAEKVHAATEELVKEESKQGNRQVLEKLKVLVLLNETLKTQEKAFKENCKKERENLVELLKKVESGEDDEDVRKMKEIERIYQTDLAKLDKLRERRICEDIGSHCEDIGSHCEDIGSHCEDIGSHCEDIGSHCEDIGSHCEEIGSHCEDIGSHCEDIGSHCEDIGSHCEDIGSHATPIAKKNQEIARLNRIIDEVPTRAELLQYERRFVELYDLVSEKLVETRKYYEMYNTLDDSHQYMTQEVKLLNQIVENFPNAMKSKQGREGFLKTFEQILEGIGKQKDQVEKDSDQQRAQLDVLKNKHAALLAKQRAYFKAVKDYEEECFKNEKLEAALAKLQQPAPREE
eukprot:g80643.t1